MEFPPTLDATRTVTQDRLDAITRYLEDDHRRLDALLERAIASEPFDAEAFAEFRVGLLRHMGIEEKVVFAEAKRRTAALRGRLADLRVQHGALTSLLVPTPDRLLAEEIRSILARHNALEEGPDGVYAACGALLDEADATALFERVVAYPAVPVAKHFDGHGVHRTAASALASSAKQQEKRSAR